MKKIIKIAMIKGVILLFFVTNVILIKSKLEVDYYDFILEGIYFIFTFICFFISLNFQIKYLRIGWGALCISLLVDMLDELKFIVFSKWQDFIFEELFFGLGLLFITYGFYKSLKEKEGLLEELKYLAFYDVLTDLPNRRSIEKHLTEAIKEALRKNKKIGILFIDLDEFKSINDTLGHHLGDDLLKLVAKRFRENIRKEDIIGRLGGDEFILVVKDIDTLDELECIAKKILYLFKEPFLLKGKKVYITCSIGISVLSDDAMNIEMLFKKADMAMYKVKEEGRNNYYIS